MATCFQQPPNNCLDLSFVLTAISQNLPAPVEQVKRLQKFTILPTEKELIYHVPISYGNKYAMPNRRRSSSLAFLTSVFYSSPLSQDCQEDLSGLSQNRSPMDTERLSTSVFYDDLESSNIGALSLMSSVKEVPFLDTDPFANLSGPPSSPVQERPALSPVASAPKSPLSPSDAPSRPFASLTASPVQPAYQRKPSFRSSPSLPSLSTLAKMNVMIPAKVRKGTVGARLPFEPWDRQGDYTDSPESIIPTTRPFLDIENEDEDEQYGVPLKLDRLSSQFGIPSPGVSRPTSPKSRNDGVPEYSGSSYTSSIFGYENESTTTDFSAPTPSLHSSTLSTEDDFSYYYSSSGSELSPEPFDTRQGYFAATDKSYESLNDHLSEEQDFPTLISSPYQSVTKHGLPAARPLFMNSSYESEEDINSLHSIDSPVAQFEPGSSASTISAFPSKESHSGSSRSVLTSEMWNGRGDVSTGEGPAVDGDEYQRGRTSGTGGYSGGRGNGSRRVYDSGGGGPSGGAGGYNSGSGGGDDKDERDRRPSFSAFSFDSEDDEEDESSSEDDYGVATGLPPATQPPPESDDDNVPLARSIPTALKAQQSLRLKDREARNKRKQERDARAAARDAQASFHSRPTSSTQEAALQASKSFRRPPKSPPFSPPLPFAVNDLTRKLENVRPVNQANSLSAPLDTPNSWARGTASQDTSKVPESRTLRPMRSFHRPEPRKQIEDWNAPPLPAAPEHKVVRSTTRARARSSASREDPSTTFPARSTSDDAPKMERKRTVRTSEGTKSARTSIDHARAPLPAPSELIARQRALTVSQQRVFIGDRQRFVVVEVNPSTTAGEVIHLVEAQGGLKEWRGSGGWMLFEIAQDFGMERPIRSFELLSDVEASWNKDKLVNVFLLKLTPLAPVLSLSALPSFSPTHSGYIEWESKRGKWNKRYMMLKEHCFGCPNATACGRDAVMLCSLSNFDAYQITRLVRAPKDFTFAVKSTDNLSIFENTADYLHIFSCRTDVGEKWMEMILLARSYVLHQERNILSNSKAHPNLSRSVTKKTPQHQTLVNVNPGNVFEPGTLLHR
ncbi:hypothetical protein BDP27DRAFT_1311189 [Rhodocollybia butyracea]|uniref:PH domain-containing protein n=1 Tax=Rhodocollybia butyracea TaxID=206335 RepID=A0A9P5UFQ3_9AGAR|nr:hypothetical protein BDP27DRAFT_1311189 [Rhodocollybia butyracea]